MNDTADFPSPGPHSYFLTVVGDSMTTPNEDSVPDGVYILVDPDQAGDVVSGDRVIAHVDGDDEPIFRILTIDGGGKNLWPLNNNYPIITDPFRILGRVIGVFTPSPRMRRILLNEETTV